MSSVGRKQGIASIAGRLIAAGSVGGWRVVGHCLTSTGTIYLKLLHEVRGNMYLRISDHSPRRLWFQCLQAVSVVMFHQGLVDGLERYLVSGHVNAGLRRRLGRWLGLE